MNLKKYLSIVLFVFLGALLVLYMMFLNEAEEFQKELAITNEEFRVKIKNKIDSITAVNYSTEVKNMGFNYWCDEEKVLRTEPVIFSKYLFSSEFQELKICDNYFQDLENLVGKYVDEKYQITILDKRLSELEIQYKNEFENWGYIVENDLFVSVPMEGISCSSSFNNELAFKSINEKAFSDFENLLKENKQWNKKHGEIKQRIIVEESKKILRSKLRDLNETGSSIFKNNYSLNEFILQRTITKSYSSSEFGTKELKFNEYYLDEERINEVIDDLLIEQYKSNSLRTGTQPYYWCYGGNKSCDDFGCCAISVKTPHNSDVLVTIKSGDKVVRHAFIRAGDSYKFEMPNGTYQTFFYYGRGWNPKKPIATTKYCGSLKGGFVLDEYFSKDSPQMIHNQILSYELILQQNGNFSTKPSNKNEVF